MDFDWIEGYLFGANLDRLLTGPEMATMSDSFLMGVGAALMDKMEV